jgi:hypothetical protein
MGRKSVVREFYTREDMRTTGCLFENCNRYSKDIFKRPISRIKVVDEFMKSGVRAEMDEWNPQFLSQSAETTFETFVKVDLDGDFSKITNGPKDDFAYNELRWIGMMYAYMKNIRRTNSKDLYSEFPIERMRVFYIWGHQMEFDAAYRRLLRLQEE